MHAPDGAGRWHQRLRVRIGRRYARSPSSKNQPAACSSARYYFNFVVRGSTHRGYRKDLRNWLSTFPQAGSPAASSRSRNLQ